MNPPAGRSPPSSGAVTHRVVDRRRLAVALLAVVVVALAVSALAAPAGAHAYLSGSDPANGERLEAAPESLALSFTGDGVVEAEVAVRGPDGDDVAGELAIEVDELTVPIEDAGDGMYVVEWEVLAEDGHTTTGTFFFSVGDDTLDHEAVLESHEADDDGVSAVEAGAKALLLVGLVGLVGAPVAARVAVYPALAGGPATAAVDRRLVRSLLAAAAVCALGCVALGPSRAVAAGQPPADALVGFLGTAPGRLWLLQLVLAGAVVALLVAAAAGRLPRRGWLAGSFAGGLALATTVSWGSHSATAVDRLAGTAVDFAHLAGAGLWVGGLLVLAVVVPPALREAPGPDRAGLAAAVVRRYSLLALAGVTVAGASGLALAAWHVPTAADLAGTLYGLVLSAKTLSVLVALGLGGLLRFVLLARLDPPANRQSGLRAVEADGGETRTDGGGRADGRRSGDGDDDSATGPVSALVRTVRLEFAVLLLVVVLSGVLTSAPTAAVLDDGPGETTIEREGEDVTLELTVVPADGSEPIAVGIDDPLVFEVAFVSDGERVASDRPVRLLADHGESGDTVELELEGTDDGTYAAVQPLSAEGQWEVRVTGQPAGSYVSEWVDVHASSGSDDGHDHGEDAHGHGDHQEDGHDHGGGAHDHGDGDAHDHDHQEGGHDHATPADDGPGPFTSVLRFGAIAVAVVGSLAVLVEAVSLRDR